MCYFERGWWGGGEEKQGYRRVELNPVCGTCVCRSRSMCETGSRRWIRSWLATTPTPQADYYYSLGHFYELLWTKVRLARFVPTIQVSRETQMWAEGGGRLAAAAAARRGMPNLCFICFSLLFRFLNFFCSFFHFFSLFLCTTLKMLRDGVLGLLFYEPNCLLV